MLDRQNSKTLPICVNFLVNKRSLVDTCGIDESSHLKPRSTDEQETLNQLGIPWGGRSDAVSRALSPTSSRSRP